MGKTLFWDFDGTLTYSPHLWSITMYDALKKQMPEYEGTVDDIRAVASGKVCSWDTRQKDYSEILGMKWWDFTERRFYEKYLELGICEKTARKAAASVHQEIIDPRRYGLYDDTLWALEESRRRGYKNYIISNNYPEMDEVMEKLGILQYFDDLIVSANVGIDKPDPGIFQIALERAGNPEECWMIGDNPRADMQGARSVGMHTILVHRDVPCAEAEAILGSLREIFELDEFKKDETLCF